MMHRVLACSLLLLNVLGGASQEVATTEVAIDTNGNRHLLPQRSVRVFDLVIESPTPAKWFYSYNFVNAPGSKITLGPNSTSFVGGIGLPGYSAENNDFMVGIMGEGAQVDPATTWRLYVDGYLFACGQGQDGTNTYDGQPLIIMSEIPDNIDFSLPESECDAYFPPGIYNPTEVDPSCRVCPDSCRRLGERCYANEDCCSGNCEKKNMLYMENMDGFHMDNMTMKDMTLENTDMVMEMMKKDMFMTDYGKCVPDTCIAEGEECDTPYQYGGCCGGNICRRIFTPVVGPFFCLPNCIGALLPFLTRDDSCCDLRFEPPVREGGATCFLDIVERK